MFENDRRYLVTEVDDLAELARLLTEHSWTTCTGFRLGELLFLNDSTGEGGAQEYAVYREFEDGRYLKIESLTCSWMDVEGFTGTVGRLLAGGPSGWPDLPPVALRLDHPAGLCAACA